MAELEGSYTPGIEINGNDHTVTHNTVRRTGRASIDTAWQLSGTEFHGNRIAYNDLSEAMRTSRDGSPFYVCCSLDGTGTSVDHYTAHDADGRVGFYVDNYSGHFLLHHNVAWNTGTRGPFFNGHTGPSIANQDHNSSYGMGINGNSTLLSGATDASGSYFSNIVGPVPVSATGTGDPRPVFRSNLISDKAGYTDPVNGELWLADGSPAIDAGEKIDGITTEVRGTAPDIGAYEHGEPIWSTGCDLPGCQQRIRHGAWTAAAGDGSDAFAAVDADVNTRWTATAAQTPGQSLTVDLGEPKTVDRLSLDAGRDTSGQPYGFSVSVSRDGTHWSGSLARVSGRSFTQDAAFPARTARFVRITLTASGPVPWVVNDLRLYGDGPDASGTLQAEQATSVHGAARTTATTGVLGSGDWVAFRRAAVHGDHLTVRLDSTCATGCALQLRLDTPRGPVAATLPVHATGATAWQEQSITLPHRLTGVHTLCLVAKGGPRVASLDWLTIRP